MTRLDRWCAALGALALITLALPGRAQLAVDPHDPDSPSYRAWVRAQRQHSRNEQRAAEEARLNKMLLNTQQTPYAPPADAAISRLYQALAHQPDQFVGKFITFDGKVVQSVQAGLDYELRVNVARGPYNSWSDTVWIDYRAKSASEGRVMEGDLVRFRGEFVGITSYRAALGHTVQIPKFIACELMGQGPYELTAAAPLACPDEPAATIQTASATSGGSSYANGLRLLQQREYDQAIVEFSTAIQANASNVFAVFRRGEAYEHKNNWENALADYKKALTLVTLDTDYLKPDIDAAIRRVGRKAP